MTTLPPQISTSLPPSRRDNPFATCWTKPGALAFRFQDDQCAEQLVAKLAAQNWWGQILGPHGSGKSTLLATLKPALAAAGRQFHEIELSDGSRQPPRNLSAPSHDEILVVDGFEQLNWLMRLQLKRRCRRAGAGLLVTAHVSMGLPTLVQLSPSRRLIEQLVADLRAQVPSGITGEDLAASHASHGSNVREIFFDLYDRHERLRRTTRTVGSKTA
jgi:energy-coupling factor transporter ATP-binding protein EcfA2